MTRVHTISTPLAGIAAALALLLLAAPALGRSPVRSPAFAPGSRYLALGDSVTFGYQESTVVPAPNYHNASSLLGYPEHIASTLRAVVANAACPGETSTSFINAKAQSNGCENSPGGKSGGYRTAFPLHVHYGGSQLAFALSYLRAHRNTRLVSLMIGGNDVFLCQESTKDGCLSSSEEKAVFTTISSNVRRILAAIRNKAHYHGQLVILNYYSLDYTSALFSGVSKGINGAMDSAARPFGAEIADGYGEFQADAVKFGNQTCTAGLLTRTSSSGSCGVHPSFAGQTMLAEAVVKAIRL